MSGPRPPAYLVPKVFLPMAKQLQLRSRDWCFTVNNYTPQDEELLHNIESKYLIYGYEVAPNTGTPHLQGYIYFANARFGHQVAKLLPYGAHIEKRMARNVDAAIDYCTKNGTNERYFEQGERPCSQEEKGRRGKEAAAWAIAKAREGDMAAIEEEQPRIFLQYEAKLESLYRPNNKPTDTLEHEWWVGPTGTGKSRLLWQLYPEHFGKDINKWWDGYRRQEVVAIEEWFPDVVPGLVQKLKRWADHNPFNAEIKGGTLLNIRPRKIIVLSNYTLEQCFPKQEDLEPLRRRFKVIQFPEGREAARFLSQLVPQSPPKLVTSQACDDLLESPEDELADMNIDFSFLDDYNME